MTTLDDKLLGEKTHYYCSSSEESGDEDDARPSGIRDGGLDLEPPNLDYKGYATHTGPKGVIEDWRQFKQLETENRKEQEKEKEQLANKLALTCRTSAEDDKEQEMLELLEDEFLQEYRLRRLQEMQEILHSIPMFGSVLHLNRATFLDAIDKEKPQVTVIIHIYKNHMDGCDAVNGCMQCLAVEYPRIKFCAIKSTETPVSTNFSEYGLPALLVYKSGGLIGNFVRITNQLGDDFFAGDLENFLQEHGILTRKDEQLPAVIRGSTNTEDNDSDLDLD
ncbi:phosducin-like protein [Saccoglossus kowalevskii]